MSPVTNYQFAKSGKKEINYFYICERGKDYSAGSDGEN
jgi:hypothetical protein